MKSDIVLVTLYHNSPVQGYENEFRHLGHAVRF